MPVAHNDNARAGSRVALAIVSGGQTGVDRAALDAALAAGLAVGGWCPAGRWAEDGRIDDAYPLRETVGTDPSERTLANVADGDATLIVVSGAWDEGTRLTYDEARRLGRPVRVIDLAASGAAVPEATTGDVAAWLAVNRVRTLNVAGPRESASPGIYRAARRFLEALFSAPPASPASPSGRA